MFDTPEIRLAFADVALNLMASVLPVGIEVWDRTDADAIYVTKCRNDIEAFELMETAYKYAGMKGSVVWDHGRIVGIWERGKDIVDLRSPRV